MEEGLICISFASSIVCLPLPWGGGGHICIIHGVSPSTYNGGGGGAHLNHSQCHCNLSGGVGGSYASSTECLPLPWWEMRTWLIYIIHNVTPFEWRGKGLICIVQSVSTYSLGGDRVALSQCITLKWRRGRGLFPTSTLIFPLLSVRASFASSM